MDDIADAIRGFLAQELRPGDPAFFADERPLISSGLVDSMVILRLVTFLEKTFPVEFQAHELSVHYLDTVALIAQTVHDKQAG